MRSERANASAGDGHQEIMIGVVGPREGGELRRVAERDSAEASLRSTRDALADSRAQADAAAARATALDTYATALDRRPLSAGPPCTAATRTSETK